jgi:hypothetical protein
MKTSWFFLVAGLLLSVSGNAQMNEPIYRENTVITTRETDPESVSHQVPDSVVTTSVIIQSGSRYDTAVFDTTWQVPFKIYENRGEEMIHSWICVGLPRAPHIYVGGGIYHFDKSGLSDIQFGWYNNEFYFSADRMFFFRKRSKEVELPITIDLDAHNGRQVRYAYQTKVRRDKFYGIVGGAAYEGNWSLRMKPFYAAENNVYRIQKSYTVSVKTGIARMRCKNIEYEAPWRRKGKFRASSMSRFSVGMIYFPVKEFQVDVIAGSYDEALPAFMKQNLSGYISWEGRVAFMHMKREWGFCANMTFMAPSWNRETDDALAFTQSWGLYFSLDKKHPRWAAKAIAR